MFFLSADVKECAQWHSDSDVCEMIPEITKMMWAAHHLNNEYMCVFGRAHASGIKVFGAPDKPNPVTIWVSACATNYKYACLLAKALCGEYSKRFGDPKHPKRVKRHSYEEIINFLWENLPDFPMEVPLAGEETFYACMNLPEITTKKLNGETITETCTSVPLCMSEDYFDMDPVKAYQKFYCKERPRSRWKLGSKPAWFKTNFSVRRWSKTIVG